MDLPELFDLRNKTAIVSGGGNGIGRACCQMLADFGANAVVADLKIDDAQNVADGISERGGQALAVACNVLQDEDLENLVQKTLGNLARCTFW